MPLNTFSQFVAQESLSEAKGIGQFTVKKTGSYTERGGPEDDAPDAVKYTEYDIVHNGKVVGDLSHDDYFGYIRGKLYGKDLPELSGYGQNKKSGPLSSLHAFLKSKTGKKWAITGKLRGKDIIESLDSLYLSEAKVGIYRKSRSPAYDGDDAHNSAAHTLVKRGGKHLTFKNDRAAQKWIKQNSTADVEYMARKISKPVKEEIEDLDLLDEEDLDEAPGNNARTLSISQRRMAGRRLKRMKTRIKVARKRALKRAANPATLKKRAKRSVRTTLFTKFSRGKAKKDVGLARRAGIERRVNRISKSRVAAMTKRQVRGTRQIDRARRMHKK